MRGKAVPISEVILRARNRHGPPRTAPFGDSGVLNDPPKRCYAQSCGSIYPVIHHEGFSIKLSRGHKTGRDLQSGQAG
jgi:hypothetical protein